MNHTPGPWHLNTYSVTNDDGIDRGFEIWGSNHSVAIIPLKPENHSHAKANGEHIVHCVNTHDALVEALQQILKHAPQAEPESEAYDDTESAYSNGYDNACWELTLIARKALTLAEKGAP